MRGKYAIVGKAETTVGVVPDYSPTELCVQAVAGAVRDAGLTMGQVDGLLTCNSFAEPIMYHAEAIAEYMGLKPRYCASVNTGGGTTFAAVQQAAAAIEAGMAHTIVIAMADSLRSFMTRERAMIVQSSSGHPLFEQPYGATVPAYYALIARAHMDRYGTTEEQMAEVAVSARSWASLNEKAQMREPITVDDVMSSRPIADPLKVLDCSLVSDGGAAIVLTSAERARDLAHQPAYILGYGEGHAYEHIMQSPDLTCSAATQSGAQAFAMAGLEPKDINMLQLYDCFTPTVLVQLEDLGICERGEAGAFMQTHDTRPGGRLPMNTHGGMLSCCHPGNPGAMFALTETLAQFRGECGARQVEHADTALLHALGGIMSSHATLILGREV